MLLEHLKNVREQPIEARRRFAFIWSLIITASIVLVWLSVLFGRSYALRVAEIAANDASDSENFEEEILPQDLRSTFDSSNAFLTETMFDDDTSDASLGATSTAEATSSAPTTEEQPWDVGTVEDLEQDVPRALE